MEKEIKELNENFCFELFMLELVSKRDYSDAKMLGFHNPDSYEEEFKNGAKYFGVFNKGKLIASGGLQANFLGDRCDFLEGDEVVLFRDLVHPSFRGNGLQRILLRERVNYALEGKYFDIQAFAKQDNLYSINNLKLEGFKEIGKFCLEGDQVNQYSFKGVNLNDKLKLMKNSFFYS